MRNCVGLLLMICMSMFAYADAPRSLCAGNEIAAFTCHLKGSRKIASLCISPDLDQDAGYMYYIFGTPQKTELLYPSGPKQHPKVFFNFNQTVLVTLASSGLYASFAHDGYRYYLYKSSWIRGGYPDKSGVFVGRDGSRFAERDLRCKGKKDGFQGNPDYIHDLNDPRAGLDFDPANPTDRLGRAVTAYDESEEILFGGFPELR